ncbi:MAG: SPOR domain-containing protein [Bacteroidetes bacterium]|nr:SPOR domain-containing protein [Bacteroidota bacterium]
MTVTTAYANFNCSRRLQTDRTLFILLIILTFLFIKPVSAQGQVKEEPYEISVVLNVPEMGGVDIPAVIKGLQVYLPITDIFDFLKIKNSPSPDYDSISGFFITQDAKFLVDRTVNKIYFRDKTFELTSDDLIRTETNLYLKSTFFGQIFGLDCSFSFRNISVTLKTKLELPAIREMRQEQMRKNIRNLQGEIKADTTIPRHYPFFHLGMFDWAIISNQQVNGPTDTRVSLSLGSVLAGGEADVSFNYYNTNAFTEKNLFYNWRFANNDFHVFRQISAGKFGAQSISSVYAPVIGMQITNTPTSFRRSFGSYRLSDHTEPGWIVELYINNVIVNYQKADASGFFSFDVPLVYGNSDIMLRFYGPWGEERSRMQKLSIPYTFLPPHKLEYSVNGGIVDDPILNTRFGRAVVNYGVTRRLTVGGGYEYLSSLPSGNSIPFLTFSLNPVSTLLVSAEYDHNVRWKGVVDFTTRSNLQISVLYLRYVPKQKAINNSSLEERKFVLSCPVHFRKFTPFVRFTFDQNVFPGTTATFTELLLSGGFSVISANLSTFGSFTGNSENYFYNTLSVSWRLPWTFVFTPEAQYNYIQNKIVYLKIQLEKRFLANAYFTGLFDQNFPQKATSIQIGFRYDFSFAQASVSAKKYSDIFTFGQNISGDVIFDNKSRYVGAKNRVTVGKSGISLLPFLDLNNNGKYDKGEPRVPGLNVHLDGGRIEFDDHDTIIRIFDLESYTNYFIRLDKNNFDNVAWQIPKTIISVATDPNMLKMIEVPVVIAGEVTGIVYLREKKSVTGLGRIIMNFYHADSRKAAQVLTEDDGYFSYLGLLPGAYYACVDSGQLARMKMNAVPQKIPFMIHSIIEGDIADSLNFVLTKNRQDTTSLQSGKPTGVEVFVPAEKTIIRKPEEPAINSTTTLQKPAQAPVLKDTGTRLAIQVGAFIKQYSAELLQNRLSKFGKPVNIVQEDGLYKVRVSGFAKRKEAFLFIARLKAEGFPEAYIVRQNSGK